MIAIVRPILEGVLFATKGEVVAQVGGHRNVSLAMLARLYRPGDGDCGICFEYAVHDAINRREPSVLERIEESMQRYCRVPGCEPASILFGAEKTGAANLIDTAHGLLTSESRLLTGAQAQPIKLKRYINMLAAAFRRPTTRVHLPMSISGLWKADLFLGNRDTDRWVGTTVKINPSHLEPARGLRIGIVPSDTGRSDAVRFDQQRNIVVCPLPYDGAFIELFYSAWAIVRGFIEADAHLPGAPALPRTPHRYIARMLEDRRDYGVLDVIAGLGPLAQPELLVPQQRQGDVIATTGEPNRVDTIIAPVSRNTQA